jgi:hypothetical protein
MALTALGTCQIGDRGLLGELRADAMSRQVGTFEELRELLNEHFIADGLARDVDGHRKPTGCQHSAVRRQQLQRQEQCIRTTT